MNRQQSGVSGFLMAMIIAAWPASAFGQDALAAARDLYAAAAYEDALAALNRLGSAGSRPEESRTIEQYRAFCLLALGRGQEAERAIEAVVGADPLYNPSESDVSPRVRTAFSDVRRRMLPTVAQQKYVKAKEAFDRKDYAAASDGFGMILQLFADSDLAAVASKPPLSDMRTLIAGFRDLSLQAIAQARTPEPPKPAPPQELPPVRVLPLSQAAPMAPPPALKIYETADTNVVAPLIVRQQLPPYPGTLFRSMVGMVEVIIDETGAVVAATIRLPVTPTYDRMVLAAAQSWRYRPATLNGVPVKYRKLIQIALTTGK